MNRLVLVLTPDQAEQIAPHLQPGRTLLGRIDREWYDGSNGETSGRLVLECGYVPTASLPALRAAVAKANKPAPRRKGKAPGGVA